MDKLIKLAVDMNTQRPGCVLIQAVAGGDSHFVSEMFDTEFWVLAPSDNMAVIAGTREQWEGHANKLKALASKAKV